RTTRSDIVAVSYVLTSRRGVMFHQTLVGDDVTVCYANDTSPKTNTSHRTIRQVRNVRSPSVGVIHE
ncbi:MAG: hypothetical protein IKV40_05960, partial [Clostridia bacterium]|nr:hypothetical protein [Clostridia bacterium]